MDNFKKESSAHITIPPQADAVKALSIDPKNIENGSVEQIGTCYRCKKPIKDWSEGGIHTCSFKVNTYAYPHVETVLLCYDCGLTLQQRVMDFIYDLDKK